MEKKYNVNFKGVEVVFKNGVKVVLCNVYLLRLVDKKSKFFNDVKNTNFFSANKYFCLFGYNFYNYEVIKTVYDYDKIEFFRILR
jgi:hypothetical protein